MNPDVLLGYSNPFEPFDEAFQSHWVVLHYTHRICAFLSRFAGQVINVHPALLPAFPGIRAVEQALEYGVKVFGVTVHFVDEGVDTGSIILQRAVELPHATEAGEVREALRPLEHDLLCEAVGLIARGAVRLDPGHPRRVLVAP